MVNWISKISCLFGDRNQAHECQPLRNQHMGASSDMRKRIRDSVLVESSDFLSKYFYCVRSDLSTDSADTACIVLIVVDPVFPNRIPPLAFLFYIFGILS